MDSTFILKNISNRVHLDAEEETLFLSYLQPKTFKKNQFLVKEGQISRHAYFINSGCCRAFTIDKNGFEHILYFASTDYWVGDMYSLLSLNPGCLYIQALEETETLQLAKMDLELLYHKIPKLERMFRILAENAYLSSQKRVMEGMSLTAKERLGIFNEKYATIKHRLPQKQIALYLGVTPEFFSRMKKEKVLT